MTCHMLAHFVLVTPPEDLQERFQGTVDSVFEGLPFCRANPDRAAAYMARVEAPLRELHRLGCTVFAVVLKGKGSAGDGPVGEIEVVHYLVVPQKAFFSIGRELSGITHRFDPACREAATELADALLAGWEVAVNEDSDALREEYEGDVPWCRECCLDQVGV